MAFYIIVVDFTDYIITNYLLKNSLLKVFSLNYSFENIYFNSSFNNFYLNYSKEFSFNYLNSFLNFGVMNNFVNCYKYGRIFYLIQKIKKFLKKVEKMKKIFYRYSFIVYGKRFSFRYVWS